MRINWKDLKGGRCGRLCQREAIQSTMSCQCSESSRVREGET